MGLFTLMEARTRTGIWDKNRQLLLCGNVYTGPIKEHLSSKQTRRKRKRRRFRFWCGLTNWHPHNPSNLFRFRSDASRSYSGDDTKFVAFAFARSVLALNGGIILERTRKRKRYRLEWIHRFVSCVFILGSDE